MFRSATFRLTAWYLALIMALSLGFSVLLYRALTAELGTGLSNQVSYFRNLPPNQGGGAVPGRIQDILDQRQEQLDESRDRVLWELAYFNALILLAGGAAGYFLARRTLSPIEEAHQAQVRFTSDASHELRTPLAAMRAELEVALRDKGLTLAESRSLHESSLQEVKKLEELTSGLLKLASHGGERQAAYRRVDLAAVAAEAVAGADKAAEAKGVALSLSADGGHAHGDGWALTEAVSILLDNAVKYTPAGGSIRVETGQDGRYGFISVTDTGAGIRATDLPLVFNRFYRADPSRTGNQGYGIGLSIAKQIADAHHGSMEVRSTVGSGSSFRLLLPVSSPLHAPWKARVS